MNTKGMTIEEICNELNNAAGNFRIGNLQNIRKELKSLTKKPTSEVFNYSTISDNYAFHVGGRSELQFNIGYEEEGLRYGFAFSLKPSQALPNPTILFPKILRLNSIIISSPDLFTDYKMLIWEKDIRRTPIHDVREIKEDEIKNGNFIFIGKIEDNPHVDDILKTFDYLLDIYIDVENLEHISLSNIFPTIYNSAFSFKQNNYNLTINKNINTVSKNIDVTVRHTPIQIELIEQLASKYGASNVAREHYHQGNRIDVVVSDKGDIYFYEIKVADSAKACIRQALGQLFEYSYFPNNSNAKKLIVAGESKLDNDCNLYIETLIRKFNIPLEYLQVTL